jgi:hypothetical protein
MTRCPSRKTVPAVRGQLDKDGKPIMVKIPCNLREGHGGQHGNEVGYEKGKDDAMVLRGGWL